MTAPRPSAAGPSGPAPFRDRRAAFAASLGATPAERQAICVMVESMPLGPMRWWVAVGSSMLVALLLAVPVAFLCGLVVFEFAGLRGGGLGTVLFLLLWPSSSLAIWITLARLALRRAREDLVSARVRSRACVRCGSGVRGVAGPPNGIVRCPECGGKTLRRAGAALADHPVALHAAAVTTSVLSEPQMTLLEETVAEPGDVDALTVALARASPGLATPALLLSAFVFLAGVGVGVPAWLLFLSVTMNVATSATSRSFGSKAEDILVPATIAVVLLLVFGLAWRVFRTQASRAWRRTTITAIEAERCFWCNAPFDGEPTDDGWHECRACEGRTPGRSSSPRSAMAPDGR